MKQLDVVDPEIKCGTLEQSRIRYGLGKNGMRQLASEAGAIIDNYFNYLSGQQIK